MIDLIIKKSNFLNIYILTKKIDLRSPIKSFF